MNLLFKKTLKLIFYPWLLQDNTCKSGHFILIFRSRSKNQHEKLQIISLSGAYVKKHSLLALVEEIGVKKYEY